MLMLQTENVRKAFTDDAGTIEVLKGITFTIQKGDMLSMMGTSGAGKTTLLQILGGLDKVSSGRVLIDGRDLFAMNPHELAQFRRDYVGFVFQFHHLLPDFTAQENVMMPGLIQGKSRKQCTGRADELLEIMGLKARGRHFPSELSGGERQRVALARALYNQPALVLADEPTGNLDSENSRQLLELCRKANKELGQTFLVATHNNQLATSMPRTIYIKDGIIERDGPSFNSGAMQ